MVTCKYIDVQGSKCNLEKIKPGVERGFASLHPSSSTAPTLRDSPPCNGGISADARELEGGAEAQGEA